MVLIDTPGFGENRKEDELKALNPNGEPVTITSMESDIGIRLTEGYNIILYVVNAT